MPMITYGSSTVAVWCGVTNAAVSNWLKRHWDLIPEPDAVIITGEGERYGWLETSRPAWEAFAAARTAGNPTVNSVRHYS